MTIGARKEYLKAIRMRYQNSSKSQKSAILDEFCNVCHYDRKYAIRLLGKGHTDNNKKPGPKVKYHDEFIFHLANLWKSMGNICSKKMVAAIPIWLPYYFHPTLTDEIKSLLLQISSASIDRCLKKYRDRKGISGTTRSFFKSKIPLQLVSQDDLKEPGFIEADTVAHCGNSIAGKFAWTLTMTDLYSGWTENRATWTKDSYYVVRGIMEVEDNLPFYIRGFACDNGTEFINENLLKYFQNRRFSPVNFVRRRPYKKNDNAHVEQKNYTHVRQVFGYDRIDNRNFVELMNEIYKIYWNPLLNHFTPTLKLIEKSRIGGKVIKKYDKPKTPYQRLMDSDTLTMTQKERLEREHVSLNPFKIRKLMDEKLKVFYKSIDTMRKLVS